MTNSLGLPDRCFSTHLQLHLHNRRKVSTTLLDFPVSLQRFPVCLHISRWTHHSHFHPFNFNQHRHQCHLPLIMNSQDLPASPASRVRVSPNQRISCTSHTKPGPSQGHPNHPKTINKLQVCAQKHKTVQHLHLPTVHKKDCVNE